MMLPTENLDASQVWLNSYSEELVRLGVDKNAAHQMAQEMLKILPTAQSEYVHHAMREFGETRSLMAQSPKIVAQLHMSAWSQSV